MKDKIKKALLSIGGKHVKVEENSKKIQSKHKAFFLNTLNTLISIQERTDKVFTEYGLNLIMYEDLYFQLIEDLVYENYGLEVGEVIFWYVNGAKLNDEEQYIEDKKTGKRYKAKTPLQVYNVCKKLKLFKN